MFPLMYIERATSKVFKFIILTKIYITSERCHTACASLLHLQFIKGIFISSQPDSPLTVCLAITDIYNDCFRAFLYSFSYIRIKVLGTG
jgi:hypothetical protein